VISLTGPPALGRPHHVGIVVPDFEAALAELAAVGGGWLRLRARDPFDPDRADPRLRLLPDTARVRLVAAYSRLGPPHLELLQGVPGTLWEPRPEAYIHHLGYWVPTGLLEERAAALDALGFLLEATRVRSTGDALIGTYHSGPAGLRIELVTWGSPEELADPGL
jgi:catechol 2,3-dioxygenase-like lactoylglutathione lyase family enzyme